MAYLQLKGIEKFFGEHRAIKGIDLDIQPGEFIVFVGPSGCGKSTLLRLIAGLEHIDGGTLSLEGRDITHLPSSKRDLAMVFQSYALYPHMSVFENMSFALKLAKVDPKVIAEKVNRAADILNLTPYLQRTPKELSGGQRQRVAIGRALVRDVDVFLFDEPLSNLDAKLRSDLRVEIKRLHQRLKNTMIYVTHDQIEAMTLADRIAIMKNGVIQQLDDPHTIYNKPVNLFVAGFIGSPSMNFLRGQINGTSFAVDGASIPLNGYKFDKTPGSAMDGVLGVRPEHIVVGEEARKMPFTVESEIEIVEPMGADTIAWTKIGGQSLTFRAASEVHLEPGQKVTIGFDPARGSVFNADSGERI